MSYNYGVPEPASFAVKAKKPKESNGNKVLLVLVMAGSGILPLFTFSFNSWVS